MAPLWCSALVPAHVQKGRGLQLEAPDLAPSGSPHARELARLGRLLRLEEAAMEVDICKCALSCTFAHKQEYIC